MQAYRLVPSSITISVRSMGSLTDTDFLPEVRLTSDSVPSHPIDRTTTAFRVDEGLYAINLLFSDVEYERVIRTEWSYSIDGQEQKQVVPVFVVSQYSSIDELISLFGLQNHTIEELYEASVFAKAIIDTETGTDFGQRFDKIRIAGNDRNTLVSPIPILRLDSIHAEQLLVYSGGAEDLMRVEISDTGYGIKIIEDDDYLLSERLFEIEQRTKFSRGIDYYVGGLFGYEYVPEDIKTAHRALVADWFCKDSTSKKNYVEQMKASDWNIKFDSRVYTGTGNFFVDKLLEPYTRYPNMEII